MKDEKKRTIKEYLLMVIVGIIINLLCLFIYKCTAYASNNSSSDYPLPYIVSNENITNYSRYNEILIASKNLNLNSVPEGSFGFPTYEGGRRYFTLYIPTSTDYSYEITLSNGDYDTFDYSMNSCQLHLISTYRKLNWHIEYNGNGFYGSDGTVSNVYITFFANSSDGYGSTLQPKYSMTNYVYEDDEYQVVFGFGNPERPIVPTGHATPPPENVSPEYQIGHARPDYVPTPPTFNSYSWTTYTPPTVDTSTIETLIQSEINTIKSIIEWLAENIHGIIENLSNNIYQGLIFIGKCVIYYGDLIIDNIQNMIKTFYDNMVSLFENIGNTVSSLQDMINEPLNTSLLSHQLNNSAFITAWRSTKSEITGFFGKFSDVSQPENVIFEIDLTGLWLDMGVSYIDFSILSPVLPYIRLVLGAILLYELIVTIITGINSYIGGNSSKNDG